MTILPKDFVNRIAGVMSFNGGSRVAISDRREPWFGPGQPLMPVAPAEDVAGRAFDYPNMYNNGTRAREYEGVSFDQLESLADTDLVRMAIETRKDQMSALNFSVLPLLSTGEQLRGPPDQRCMNIEQQFKYPDRKNTWHNWQRLLVEEQLVTDAATIYIRRTQGGDPYSFDVVAGKTIRPLLDMTGRAPEAPAPAYQQILKGMAAIDYSTDELIYAPRNPRPGKVYGCSPTQQLMMTINIIIRREVAKLSYYVEGNVPEALVSVPPDWSGSQIQQFQSIWDAMMTDQFAQRRKLKFIPGGSTYQPTREASSMFDQFDEWLARNVCYCFSLPPTAFVQQQNRATAESAYDAAISEGLQPMMIWFKSIMDRIIQHDYGYADLEFVWDEEDEGDSSDQQERDLNMIRMGVKSVDEVRAKMGLQPIGMSHALYGLGPQGITFVDDLVRAHSQGLTAIQPPPPPPMIGPNGQPIPQQPGAPPAVAQIAGPAPAAAAPQPAPSQPAPSQPVPSQGTTEPQRPELAGIPASLLAAVGLGPQGSAGRAVDVTDSEEADSDPMAPHVGHPVMVGDIRAIEAMQQGYSN